MTIRLREIDHLVLRVIDLDRMLRFYCEVLGCTIERRQDAIGLVQLRAGRSLVDLVPVDGQLGAAGGAPPGKDGRNLDHFCFRVDPFDEADIRRQLSAHRIDVGPLENRYGAEGEGPSIYIADPEGNVIELKGPTDDPYDLARFVLAQQGTYKRALSEITAGAKRSHWIWFVFPQIDGLGASPTARRFAIQGTEEARAYLDHPSLGPRLVECAEALLNVKGLSAHEIFGSPDDLKLRSCATLFARVSPQGSVFHQLLDVYYESKPDPATLRLLSEADVQNDAAPPANGLSEKQKMLAGEPYFGNDTELVAERERTRALCLEFNTLNSPDSSLRQNVLARLLGRETDAFVTAPFHCDYGYNIILGANAYFNFNCVILDVTSVTIGKNALFGPGVHIYTATHPMDATERRSGLESGKPVVIGDDVWVGGSTVICPGVTIGSGAVIGAGSVVTRDIPAGVFAAGNPCRVIRTTVQSEARPSSVSNRTATGDPE